MTNGTLIGVGVGPGDPELLTLKAYWLIQNADVISYLVSPSGVSHAKDIARLALEGRRQAGHDIAIHMPMSKDRARANEAYDEGGEKIRAQLKKGKNVVFLCEGDPLFFGSFSYLLERLQGDYVCQVVPGISSVNAAASALTKPLTLLKESFVVVSGRHSDQYIEQALTSHDSVVIMKAGQSRSRIIDLLEKTERVENAYYLENIGREKQRVIENIALLTKEAGPYFSLFVVLPKGRCLQ